MKKKIIGKISAVLIMTLMIATGFVSISIIKAENLGERPLVFEPPWDEASSDSEKNVEWIADAGYEDVVISPSYGSVGEMYASAGVGYGTADMTIWFTHGFWFSPPVTDTYTIAFTYEITGYAFGVCYSEVGDASDSNLIKVLCNVGDEAVEVMAFSKDDYHETEIDWCETITMSVDLNEGTSYYVGAQACLKSEASCILGAGATAHMGNPQDIQVQLKKVTIDWPNHPPNIPEIPNGPETASVGKEHTFTTITTDPEGDNIRYGWDFGDGTLTQWGDWGYGYIDYTWEETGTYKVRAKAEDEFGAKSEWSDPLTVEITNDPPSKPDVWYESVSLFKSEYHARSNDPDGHQIKYVFKFDDGTVLSTGFMNSGQTGSVIYKKQGGVVWAVDEYGAESPRASQSCSSSSNSTDDSGSDSS